MVRRFAAETGNLAGIPDWLRTVEDHLQDCQERRPSAGATDRVLSDVAVTSRCAVRGLQQEWG